MTIESFLLVRLSKQLCSQATQVLNHTVLVSLIKVRRQVVEFFSVQILSFGIPSPNKGKAKMVEYTIMR